MENICCYKIDIENRTIYIINQFNNKLYVHSICPELLIQNNSTYRICTFEMCNVCEPNLERCIEMFNNNSINIHPGHQTRACNKCPVPSVFDRKHLIRKLLQTIQTTFATTITPTVFKYLNNNAMHVIKFEQISENGTQYILDKLGGSQFDVTTILIT